MSVSQRLVSGRFFGAAQEGLERPRFSHLARSRSYPIRVPRSVHAEIGHVATAARRAADRDPKSVREVERTLLRRATMGPNAADYARIESIGYSAWLNEQLNFESLDDTELEDALNEALPTLSMSPQLLYSNYDDNPFIPILELWVATVYRALYSPRQLFERLTIFWSDHFSIDVFGDYQYMLKPVDNRDVVRAHALGTFPELLSASAHSASMLIYLTNDSNDKAFPNENYARELMELHTMGADNGYTETDVKEVARCVTGWTWNDPYRGLGKIGDFRFSRFTHDTGTKKVLGRTIPAGGGIEDGERVLEILVKRKETAEFIATKLLRYLWGYEPTAPAVRKVKRVFQQTGGNIRSMVRAALSETRMQTASPKLKRPFHLAVSSLRALGADVGNPFGVLDHLADAGHELFAWTPPNGYPDSAEYWSGFVLPRWNFAANLFDEDFETTVDAAVDDPAGPVSKIVERLNVVLLTGTMTDTTRDVIEGYLGKGRLTRRRVREVIGLVLTSPEFQEY